MKSPTRNLASIARHLNSRVERTRWQAAIALGEFAKSDPEKIWPLVVKHGSRRHADTSHGDCTFLLDRQLCALEQKFLDEGGLRERMTRARLKSRQKP